MLNVPSSASHFPLAPGPERYRELDAPADGCGDGRHPSSPRPGPPHAIISQQPDRNFCFLPPVLSILPLASIDFPQFPQAPMKQLPTRLPRGPLLLFVEQKNHQHCLQRCSASGGWDQDAELPLLVAGSKGIAEESCAQSTSEWQALMKKEEPFQLFCRHEMLGRSFFSQVQVQHFGESMNNLCAEPAAPLLPSIIVSEQIPVGK